MNNPVPPKNVRLTHRLTGQVVPVELMYQGRVDGLHHWLATAPVAGNIHTWRCEIDQLPAKTSISLEFTGEPHE